jgi:hypothetical protein
MARPGKYAGLTHRLSDKIPTITGLTPDEKEFILEILAKRWYLEKFCKNGHRRTAKTTYIGKGERYPSCRICESLRQRGYNQAKRQRKQEEISCMSLQLPSSAQ